MGFSKYKKSPIFIILKWIHKNRAFEIAIQRNPIFFHPDFTVGTGITPVQPAMNHCEVVDFHHRSGISPCPEDESYLYFCYIQTISDTYALVKSDCNGFEIFFLEYYPTAFLKPLETGNGPRMSSLYPVHYGPQFPHRALPRLSSRSKARYRSLFASSMSAIYHFCRNARR